MINSILVIAPHPDDDILGCGGLMHRVSQQNGKVHVALANIEQESRAEELINALSLLPNEVTIDIFGNHPDGLDILPIKNLSIWISNLIQKYNPQTVLIPDECAHHQDHRACYEASIIACRPSGGTQRHRPPIVLLYEIASDIWPPRESISPQLTISLSEDNISFKCSAMLQHKSQLRDYPSERSTQSIINLAKVRGSQAGVHFGEAYRVIRWLI